MKRAFFIIGLFASGLSYAAHPLVTDDTGTQGIAHAQFELNVCHGVDRLGGTTRQQTDLASILSLGLGDRLDVVVGLPLSRVVVQDPEMRRAVQGVADVPVELKWRFLEAGAFSLAVKPGATIPTGDHTNGLGRGRMSHQLHLIGTQKAAPGAFHLNLGYFGNNNRLGERNGIWHASLATELQVTAPLRLVANLGVDRSPDGEDESNPVFAVLGLICSPSDHFDVNAGLKTDPKRGTSNLEFLAGLTTRR